jgi:hypothetical protein
MLKNMPNQSLALANINQWNRLFWVEQSELLDRRIQDAALRQIAMDDLKSEEAMRVPVRNRKTLEHALAQAEKSRSIFQRAFSRKGGKAAKTDALQCWIMKTVRADKRISSGRLLLKIRKMAKEGHPVVFRVDRKSGLLDDQAEHIHFRDNGRDRTSPVSGLKDRLSRAKKEILSR